MGLMSAWVCESDPYILRRVGKTGEEAAELVKVCCRIVIQGIGGIDPVTGVPNIIALEHEIADCLAQFDVTIAVHDLSRDRIESRRRSKVEQMMEWEFLLSQMQSKGS